MTCSRPGRGPLYVKLQQALAGAIRTGRLKSGDALPPERDLAEYASISRVTVRKAVDELVHRACWSVGMVRAPSLPSRSKRSSSRCQRLTSFTEDMARRAAGHRERNGSNAACSRRRRTR